jgi:hypothetical protein
MKIIRPLDFDPGRSKLLKEWLKPGAERGVPLFQFTDQTQGRHSKSPP